MPSKSMPFPGLKITVLKTLTFQGFHHCRNLYRENDWSLKKNTKTNLVKKKIIAKLLQLYF